MGVYIAFSDAYLRTDSWVMAKIIQLSVNDFCRKFLTYQNDPCRRQFDQTTQAARAVPANIAEGSARKSTSIETEMRLLDVARASLVEVIDDFAFFVMDKGEPVWNNENPMAYEIRGLRLDTPTYGKSLLHDATSHVLTQKKKFDKWLQSDEMIVRANAIIILCQRTSRMLRGQLENLLGRFESEGGFTENMTQTRLEAKKQQNAEQGAPKCPLCGETMTKRTIRKGERAGRQFWGCPNYYKTGCKGSLKIDCL